MGVGVGIGATFYLVNRSHTSLTGCISQAQDGMQVSTKDGQSYKLVNAPTEVKPGTRVSLRGHKTKTAAGREFRVDRVSHQYGACGA